MWLRKISRLRSAGSLLVDSFHSARGSLLTTSKNSVRLKHISRKLPKSFYDPTNSKLMQFVQDENRSTSEYLSVASSLERELYLEMRQRLVEKKSTVPEKIGDYEYYMKQIPTKNYPIFYRKQVNREAEEEILLDQNQLARNYPFMLLGSMKVSPDGRLLAYTLDIDGTETYEAFIKDLTTGSTYSTLHMSNVMSIEWSCGDADRSAIYYTIPDEYRRPYQVYRHTINSASDDELVYEEKDMAFFVDLNLTKDKMFVTINCNSKTTSEVHVIDADSTSGTPSCILKRQEGMSYFLDHAEDCFYVVTNSNNAPNYKIMKISGENPSSWDCFVPDSADVKIEDVDVFKQHVVLYEKFKGEPRIRVYNRNHPEKFELVPIPDRYRYGVIVPGMNKDFESEICRFSISTPLEPELVYDYHMQTGVLTLRQQISTPLLSEKGAFESEDFECTRVSVKSFDAVEVPMTLIHKKHLALNGKNPTLVFGYGAYGINNELDYANERLSLLQRGWIIALPHVRGGGELGLNWYNSGKQQNKMNTFHDFVGCLRFLLEKRYTSPNLLGIHGTSAGGMIMGYIANEYPRLVNAVIMKVPFVDVLSTMLDRSLPLTVHEFDEWGDPREPSVRKLMGTYSPCDNIRVQAYPSIYITCSTNDQRVPYTGVLKFVLSAREAQERFFRREKQQIRASPILLRMSLSDSHMGPGGKLDEMQNAAEEYAFLFRTMGLISKE